MDINFRSKRKPQISSSIHRETYRRNVGPQRKFDIKNGKVFLLSLSTFRQNKALSVEKYDQKKENSGQNVKYQLQFLVHFQIFFQRKNYRKII